jgi:hypothetical protein
LNVLVIIGTFFFKMIEPITIAKKTLRIIGWAILGIMVLLISIALLIRVPAVQNKLISYAASYISGKTNTKVEIKKISLSFPKSVRLEGLFLDDLEKDTLLYAEKIFVNIAFYKLFDHKIHFKDIELENVTVNLSRKETDTLFNYNFLLTAFSDPEKKEKKDTSASKWAIGIDNISLRQISFSYKDEYGGTKADIKLDDLELSMEEIDVVKQLYSVNDLQINGLQANVLIKTGTASQKKNENNAPLPIFTAKKINIKNSFITYTDSIGKAYTNASVNKLILKEFLTDLQSQKVELNRIELSNSLVEYAQTDSLTNDAEQTNTGSNNWSVDIKHIDLSKNILAYSHKYKIHTPGHFDPAHLTYRNVSLKAEDFVYSRDNTEVTVKDLSAIDANNHVLQSLNVKFRMDPHSMMAAGIRLQTQHSKIDADIGISYSSLRSLRDSIQFMTVNAVMRNVVVKTSDIVYFSPELARQSFFKSEENISTVSGTITGPVNNLRGKKVLVKTGSNTMIETDFIIAGLPYAELAYFNLPDLKVNSGRKDLEMIVGKTKIPETISLPEMISLRVNFKGRLKAFTSTVGLSSSYGSAHLFAIIDDKENFTANTTVNHFDLGLLLKNQEMFGPVTLSAKTQGRGLDKNSITAKLNAEVSEVYLNQYPYKNLSINGQVTGQKFEGRINLDDPNAVFDFDGYVDLNKNHEAYKFSFDLKAADLQKLHFSKDELRISLIAVSDLKGSSAATINGKAGVTNIVIAHNEKKYILDSFLFASINEKGKSELNISSAIVGINYTGTFSPVDVTKEMKKFVNNYFTIPLDAKDTSSSEAHNFSFEIQLHNHPVLSEVFLPQLKEFEPGIIQGSFNSQKQELILDASLRKLVYGSTELNNISFKVNSDMNALNYNLTSTELSNSQLKLENLSLTGKAADNTITSSLSSVDEKMVRKLEIHSSFTKDKETYIIKIDPDNFYIMDDKWNVAPDNFLSFNKSGILFHNLFIEKSASRISVISINDQYNDDIEIIIKNLQIEELSRIIEKDTSIARGSINGHVLLKKVNDSYGIIADASINDLIIREVPVGNFTVKAENPTTERFLIDAKLTGPENDVVIKGTFTPNDSSNALNMDADIRSLGLKTVEVLSMGQITSASGTASGKFSVRGKTSTPDVLGSLTFKNAFLTPTVLNSRLQLKNETIELKKEGVYFNSFTVLDPKGNTAVVNGNIAMNHFKDLRFALNINTNDFTLFNTTARDHEIYYGKMIIDSRIKVSGDVNLPVVNAKIKLKKGSNFTFAVPEKKLTTDKGEGIVEFTDSSTFHPIITRNDGKSDEMTTLKGIDISSIIEVDKEATLKLLIDPYSGDSLVVRGDAALSFSLDPSGKMSLTGAYDLNDGSYLVSFESVLKRKFDISPESTIIWNGDPLDATVNINATYSVRAAPVDLVSDQLAGLSETEQSGYKQRYPFIVLLKLRGDLLHPEISFEIQLPPEDKGILGGAVNAKLNMLNEDPSALNKQVFALLVLGRFIQENPLQTETNAASNAARTTVSRFLSAQLNQLSSKVVPGVELNFDVQSYDDYESGQAEGRTEVEIGVKKQLFDERLSVQVGGSVDVEGEKAKQNSASDITGDVTLEYKLSKDGRYRLKGFRNNQYEGALEGQIVETGAGILYIKDFDKWREFFRPNKKKKAKAEKGKE